MAGVPSKYDEAFRDRVIKEYKAGGKMNEIAASHGFNQSIGYKWIRDAGLTRSPRPRGKGLKGLKKPLKILKGGQEAKPLELMNGRMEMFVRAERAKLLQFIGEQAVELAHLRGRK